MRVSLIAAAAENDVIGVKNEIPWHLPRDLREFKRLTMGHHLVMGRKTWDSVGGLPGRSTVVLSRSALELPDGVVCAASLDEALDVATAAGDDEAFVAGGGEIYRQALARADRVYLTRVHGRIEGDTTFPQLDDSWVEVSRVDEAADDRHAFDFSFLVYHRAAAPAPART